MVYEGELISEEEAIDTFCKLVKGFPHIMKIDNWYEATLRGQEHAFDDIFGTFEDEEISSYDDTDYLKALKPMTKNEEIISKMLEAIELYKKENDDERK